MVTSLLKQLATMAELNAVEIVGKSTIDRVVKAFIDER